MGNRPWYMWMPWVAAGRRGWLFLLVVMVGISGCRVTPKVPPHPALDLGDPISREEMEELLRDPGIQMRTEEEYYLGPGDVIELALVGRPDVFGRREGEGGLVLEITENPTVSLPMIGAVRVHNRTVAELQEELTRRFSTYIKDPVPLVVPRLYARNQFTVLGTVHEPGTYPLKFGDTLMDAIFRAGGLTPGGAGGGMAPGRYLKIYREKVSPEERAKLSLEELLELVQTEEGLIATREEYTIPITELILNGSLTYNIPVAPDDIIYIAPAGTASVMGRVDRPGVVFLGPSVASLNQVIAERGGLRYSAASVVEVVRTYPDGQQVTYQVDVRKVGNRRAPDFRIQAGDEIFVYTHPVRLVGEKIGEIFRGSLRAGASATYNPVG